MKFWICGTSPYINQRRVVVMAESRSEAHSIADDYFDSRSISCEETELVRRKNTWYIVLPEDITENL